MMSPLRNGTHKLLLAASRVRADNSAQVSLGLTTSLPTTCKHIDFLALLIHADRGTSYLYGGYGFGNPLAYDDAYILSIPSFTWIKAFPTDNSTGDYPHGGCSANVVNRDQMLIIGGWFPEADANFCDSPGVQGQHGMNLGYNGEKKALWDKYDPTLTTYFVPTPIISAIGGGYALPFLHIKAMMLTVTQTYWRSHQNGTNFLEQS